METLYRYVSGAAAGIAGLFAPAGPLITTTLLFIVMGKYIFRPDMSKLVHLDVSKLDKDGSLVLSRVQRPAAPAVRGTSRAARRGARSQRPPSS